MNKVITIYEAKTNLSKYIKQAKAGTPVYIGSYGDQEVVLMAAEPPKNSIKFGTAGNTLRNLEANTDAIDPDVQAMFYGKDWQRP